MGILISGWRNSVSAPLTDDASFLRRVTLDLTGRVPSVDEVRRFASDRSPRKRLRTIDALLASSAATDYWTHRMMVALRAEALVGRGKGEDVASYYQDFLRAEWTEGTPLPEVLARLISASGTPQENGAVGFYLSAPDARAQTELFAELVLGVRMRCANCHDHPLDRWTQEDYHGLAALFAGVRRGEEVGWYPGATNINPATGEPALPRLPDGTEVPATTDPRNLLAEFVRDRGAPLMARAWVNRIWADLFGHGLVNPVDDLRGSNPATHPALLDAIADVTSLDGERPSTAPEHRAIERVSLSERFASSATAERCGVTTVCPDDLRESLSGRLAIIVGPLVNGKIADPRGAVQHWANDPSVEPAEVIEQIYLRCLSRVPDSRERQYWLAQLTGSTEYREALEHMVWSLLTSHLFMTNH